MRRGAGLGLLGALRPPTPAAGEGESNGRLRSRLGHLVTRFLPSPVSPPSPCPQSPLARTHEPGAPRTCSALSAAPLTPG